MNEEIKKIIVEYEDGSVKELNKGAVVSFRYDEITEEHKITIEMKDFKRRDLEILIEAMIETGDRMGMFDDVE